MAAETVGFIGLGALGLPIANNLVDAGYQVRVYNRTPSKASALVERGAVLANRPADVVVPGGVVVTLIWDDASVEDTVRSDGFLERLGPGGLHISMSTLSPEGARRIDALHKKHGSVYIEAPIFGTPPTAASKMLTLLTAGPTAAKERARPLLDAMGGKKIFDFGEAIGAATTVKLAGNFLLIGAGRQMTEALTLVEKSGVDTRAVVDMLTTALLPAPIYQTFGRMFIDRPAAAPRGRSNIGLKDIGLFVEAAGEVGASATLSGSLLDLLKSEGH